nr:uncharacterized protein LOC109165678 isoform X1 [Ipomoea trifida]
MAAKPLTKEAIALTEKKMDMTLDDIIKMSKNNSFKAKKQGVPNRNQKFSNNASHDKSAKFQRFMETRSSLRQGALAQRRSSFQGNHFPLVAQAARKAAAAPIHNRGFSRGRVVNMNGQRVAAPQTQRNVTNKGGFSVIKQQQLQHKVRPVTKQKPQTLDSLFANMKEQRMKNFSQQHTNAPRRNGGSHGQTIVPWARGLLGK